MERAQDMRASADDQVAALIAQVRALAAQNGALAKENAKLASGWPISPPSRRKPSPRSRRSSLRPAPPSTP